MPTDLKPLNEYIRAIEKELVAGNATEPSHYPALKALIEGLAAGVSATNNPKHIECGAPDFLVTKGSLTIGYIEAKDVGKSFDEAEKSEQLKRYRESLSNLILTDYLEFRWYVDGERCLTASLGSATKEGKIKRDKAGIEAVNELLALFLSHPAESAGTPKKLAHQMAKLSHRIREGAEEALNKGIASDLLNGLYKALQETLIPDLEIKVFSDMYAQTIAYGLFIARYETDKPEEFSRQNAASLIPKTNPFLKDLFYQTMGPSLDDEPYRWAVDELIQFLKLADMSEIMKDFGKGTGKDDPVVYFYQDFLREYDKKLSEMRGVYYTPVPVVSYIVRSIDYLLKHNLNRPQGLADKDTYILDPAAGTGTFLFTVINEIYKSMLEQGQAGQWDGYVAKHLIPRIFGFELLMVPYVIAHLKLGLELKNTGYDLQSKQRLEVYLTNTLEDAAKSSEMLMAQYIVREANSAIDIKKEKRIMVVLGNPPYSGHSANKSEREEHLISGQSYIHHLELEIREVDGVNKASWRPIVKKAQNPMNIKIKTFIGRLIEDYKIIDGGLLDEKNPKWLQDDYVKFIRFGQWRLERTGQGILGFITNHSYLDNPTFRGMRQSLLNTFTDIYILNLHGNAKKKEIAPDGGKDENVFDIQQGVAISIFVKQSGNSSPATVHYADLWGLREGKYQVLAEDDVTNTGWKELKPCSPFYLFTPRDEALSEEYEKGWKVNDVFPVNSVGVVTGRDELTIRGSGKQILDIVNDFVSLTVEEARDKYKLGLDTEWKVSQAQKDLKDSGLRSELVVPILYRPFDTRYTYYTGQSGGFIGRPRPEVMQHMLVGLNLGLISARSNKSSEMDHFFSSRLITEAKCGESTTQSCFFPLYLYPAEGEMHFGESRRPNLNPEFIKAVSEKLGLKFIADGKGDLKETFGPEDIFNYAYAVFHSPTYRKRYAEFLKIDFPRLPLTSNKELFKALVAKGAELVSLHLMESPVFNTPITEYPVTGSNEVEKVAYDEKTGRIYINKTQYFEGVPPEVWNFHIGGYQVCQKWLKYRKGRKLTYDDLDHYQKIVIALKETIRLMAEIDSVIPGWPLG